MASRVQIEVLEAKNLFPADSGGIFPRNVIYGIQGTSDPYCTVHVVGSKDAKHRVKTKVLPKTLSP